MPSALRDIPHTLRQLRRSPGYAIAVVLTLALAIGVNTAVFTMLDGFLLRRLPYPNPQRLAVLIFHVQPKGVEGSGDLAGDDDSNGLTTWLNLHADVPSVLAAATGEPFRSEGGIGSTEGIDLDAGAGSSSVARYMHAVRVSAHYFQVLGIEPLLGRGFTEAEDSPGAGKAVVISYALWKGMFHKNPHLLGRTIRLKGAAYTVVGILPPHAIMPHPADVWIPLIPTAPHGLCVGGNCLILMRLKPGATWTQVRAELARMPLPPSFDPTHANGWFYPEPIQRYTGQGMGARVELFMLAVSLILIIACANLAGLTLVRVAHRTPEIATRIALGATYRIILMQLWTESLILTTMGAALGLAGADGLLHVLRGVLPEFMVPIGGFHVDRRVLIFTILISIATSLLFGALPAMKARRVNLQQMFSTGSRTVAGGTGRLRQILIGGQIALTVILLAGAGLMIRTVIYLDTLPPGFNPHHVVAATASIDSARYKHADEFHTLLRESVAALKATPGVKDAAMGLSVPYQRGLNNGIAVIDGKRASYRSSSSLAWVTPGYFATLQIPILAGRALRADDTSNSQPVAVVNMAFANEFYRNADPIGYHFYAESKKFTIVGVVGNVVTQPGGGGGAPLSTKPVVYIPAEQMNQAMVNLSSQWFQPSWIIRYRGNSASIEHALQQSLSKVAPDLPVAGFYSMQQLEQRQIQDQRVEVLLLSTLAILALLLSVIGVYALVSNLVVQRTREIGIRVALGSPWKQVIVSVGLPGMTSAIAGVCAGLIASVFALRLLKSAIYGIHDLDPVTLTIVPLLLIVLAAAASIIPSLRVTHIDPAETLREE